MGSVVSFPTSAPHPTSQPASIAVQSDFVILLNEDLKAEGDTRPGWIRLNRLIGLFQAFGVQAPSSWVELDRVTALWKRISGLVHTARLIQVQPSYEELLLAPLAAHKRRYVMALLTAAPADLEAAAKELGVHGALVAH